MWRRGQAAELARFECVGGQHVNERQPRVRQRARRRRVEHGARAAFTSQAQRRAHRLVLQFEWQRDDRSAVEHRPRRAHLRRGQAIAGAAKHRDAVLAVVGDEDAPHRVGFARRHRGVRAVDALGVPERQRALSEFVVAQAGNDGNARAESRRADSDVGALAAGPRVEAVAEHGLAGQRQARHARHQIDVPAGDADDVNF